MTERYALGGFVVESAIALPELPRTAMDNGPLGRITIDREPIPDRIDGVVRGLGATVAAREILLEIDPVGRLWIRDGVRISVSVLSGALESDLRPFIFGSAIGAICHQRGLVPLHASTVVARGRAFAFLGDQGAGKSTTAAGLMQWGFAPLADDLTVVDLAEDGMPIAFPGVPWLKLWPETAEALALGADAIREFSSVPKLQIPFTGADAAALGGLYLLEEGSEVAIERVPPEAATALLLPQLYRRPWVMPGEPLLKWLVALRRIATRAPVFRLVRPKDFDILPEIATILRVHADLENYDRTRAG